MLRKIVSSAEKTVVLELPDNMVGKQVEVLAFEIEGEPTVAENTRSIEELLARFAGLTFDSKGGYTFNRDEATDYE